MFKMNVIRGKRIAVIGFCVFLAFMALCTVIAKGIYRSQLPQVTTQTPYSGSLVHEIKASGTVKQGQEYGIFVENGLRVSSVVVRNGEYFEAVTPLFQIDTEDLQRIIEENELEINKLKSLQKENLQTEDDIKKKQNKEIVRAKEDYDNVVKEADAQIKKCKQALEEAQQELALYDQYLTQLSQSGSSVSSGDAVYTQQYNHKERRYQLVQNVTSCSLALEDAERQKVISLQTASRIIEDVSTDSSTTNSAYESTNLDISHKEKELSRLKKILEAEGWIYSESAGRVTECRLAIGQRTQDDACILYAEDEGERIIEAIFTGGNGSYLTLNAELSMKARLADGSRMNDTIILDYVEELENGDTLAELSIDNLDLDIGQTVELSYLSQTENYTTCVPSICVHCSDESGGNYVYAVEEREGILGIEWKVREVFVTILDQTNNMVAIESAEINTDTRIVTSVNDKLEDGDVVRLLGG